MTIGERINAIREELGMTQAVFAEKLGTARNTIANYEIGRREPMESTVKAICREFHVNYFWLTEGDGEMFDALPESIVDELAQQYDLDDLDKRIVLGYLRLSEDERNTVKKYIRDVLG